MMWSPARRVPSTIAVAIPKQDRPEWIVQKAAETVDRIVFLHAERSVVRWDGERAERHRNRPRVAGEALMQSRRVWLPEIVGPLPAADVLPEAVAAEPGGRAVTSPTGVMRDRTGGWWTPDELALAQDRVAVGDAVLRVETAALVACAEMCRRQTIDPTLPKFGVCTLRGRLPFNSHGGITQSEKWRGEGYERERRLRGCIGIQRACR